MNIVRITKENLNLGSSIWQITEDKSVLDTKDFLLLDIIEFGEIGFERKSDWVRFCNKLDSCDITPLRRRFIGDKKEGEYYANMEFDFDNIHVTFKDPISVVVSEIGDDYIISEIKEFKGRIAWNWLYSTNNKLEIADICEVFITDIKYLK